VFRNQHPSGEKPVRIHDRWSAGKAARNAWQHLPGTYLSELLAASGADVVTLDLQHGMMDLPAARDSILAIEARGATPFARLPGLDAMLIGHLLDSGAVGLICPTVETGVQAEALVAAAHYPPRGRRSCGPMRAALAMGGDYIQAAPDLILTFAMIETVAGLDAVNDIAATADLTGLFIGPGDLGISLGIGPGQDRSEPEIVAAITRVRAAAQRHGKRLGIHAASPGYAARMADEGFDLVTICSDAELVVAGVKNAILMMGSESSARVRQ